MSTSAGVAELDGLLNRLVDDQLDEAGSARLQDVLRADGAARRRYRQVLALHASLQWDYVAAARGEAPVRSSRSRPSTWPMPAMLAATLLAAFLVPWSWWTHHHDKSAGLTISALNEGTLTWYEDDHTHELQVGERRQAGSYHLHGEGATAVLNFHDGTQVTMIGESDLDVLRMTGKHLHLQEGSLTADVRPQPADAPMLIVTDTARLIVLGTRFTVHTENDKTSLEVDHGRVRIERLADGQEIELTDGQQTTVSLDATTPIAVITRPQIPNTWRVDFAQRPPSHWSGTWTAPAGDSVGFFAAMPYTAGRDANGRPIIHHGVRIQHPQEVNRAVVRLASDSRLTMRFRLLRGDSRTPVKVMLCAKRDNGSFAGTFFASIDALALPMDEYGWRTAVLAMPAFVPSRPTVHPSPVGHQVTFVLVNSTARPAGLEVASLAIDQP